VKEILYNLLSNAVKFTPEGGKVWIESADDGNLLDVSICDTGVGIPEAEQSLIFDKFYQAGDSRKATREGTGLGLAITKHLVELHGGHISVVSRPGHGSRFKVSFPLAHAPAIS
jgi:signal transduction histidine kinase